MDIAGTYTLQATPEEVWQCLSSQQALTDIFPGLESLDVIDTQTSSFSLHVKQPPLTGTYNGLVTVTEQAAPSTGHLTITSVGDQNTLRGNGKIELSERDGYTVIAYHATLTIDRPGTQPAPTVVKGTVKMILQQFFSSLSEQVRASRRTQEVSIEERERIAVIQQAGGTLVILPPPPLKTQHAERATISQTIARRLGLGAGDAEQELLWAKRLRRISFISALLLLVWVGMRIPQRWAR